MDKNILKAVTLLIVTTIISIFYGCGDSSDGYYIDESSEQSKVIGNICTKWGASQTEVMNYMAKYEEQTTEEDFICYKGKGNIKTISYQLKDGKLQASLALLSEKDVSLQNLQSLFSEYEYLGEKNGSYVYVSENENTMVTICTKVRNEITYYAVGYTSLVSDM